MDFDYVALPVIIVIVGVVLIWLSLRRILSLSTKSYRTGGRLSSALLYRSW